MTAISRWGADPDSTYSRDSLYHQIADMAAIIEAEDSRGGLSSQDGYRFSPDMHADLLYQLGWWKLWNQPANRQPFDWQTYCDASVNGISSDGKLLECWLDLNPHVSEAMQWENVDLYGNVQVWSYDQWDGFMQNYLFVYFDHYYQWLENSATAFPAIPLPDPPVNQEQLADDHPAITALARLQAQVLYLQNVAHSLALEIGGFVPWSIRHYFSDELEMLLASESFFNAGFYGPTQANNPDGVSFKGYWPQEVTPSPPSTTFSFVVEKNILRAKHVDTISRLLKWGRENMYHYGGGRTAGNMYNHWQYHGHPPVMRMLSHGDDVFNVRFNIPSVDPDYFEPNLLLINQDKLLYWFNASANADAGKNVGRQVREIALQVLPDRLMEMYCEDL